MASTPKPGDTNSERTRSAQRVNATTAFGLALAGLVIQLISAAAMLGLYIASPYSRHGGGYMFEA